MNTHQNRENHLQLLLILYMPIFHFLFINYFIIDVIPSAIPHHIIYIYTHTHNKLYVCIQRKKISYYKKKGRQKKTTNYQPIVRQRRRGGLHHIRIAQTLQYSQNYYIQIIIFSLQALNKLKWELLFLLFYKVNFLCIF